MKGNKVKGNCQYFYDKNTVVYHYVCSEGVRSNWKMEVSTSRISYEIL